MGQLRGQLTDRIKEKSKELLGYEINRTELRLMPYILTVMINDQKLDPRSMNQNDRDIFQKWKEKGYCEGGMTGLAITKEFWNIITEIVFLGYVELSEEDHE